ncbi:4-hydroxy-tetrahydrodipicolinate synthase [Parvibium lacunae]|uniref:4-hydroxy-tetrahydrodipicolinate synthase n=1 Tax=Parvibium lacunae TaxID=1888893 RepID=A0A368L7I2_9BURK|nr:4-hydroxy-tetrahydrodipicolinate synthase [Parvibium lacunae]RCS59625.1 4-hydroxy-tetrahydrodipicolinate synthase [Parvibium lacunae]
MLQGSIVALVTPMTSTGEIDWSSFRQLIDWHIAEQSDGLVIVGTTGESPTVNVEEHCELIRVAVEQSAGRIAIIAGTGGNSTAEAIELTAYAKQVGADYSLSVVPYYNKPTQEGLYQHFKSIAEAVDLPLILYNVPGRTVADMSNETVLRLAQIPGIVGIKDATGNLERGAWLIKEAPQDFAVYSGDDATAVFLTLAGGKGDISVTANVVPRRMHQLCQAALAGDLVTAMRLHYELLPLHRHLFVEANPIPVKWALAHLGKIPAGIRLPLVELSVSGQAVIKQALVEAGV